ncbi:hypothetical protein BES08_20455 (plasmid) [Novosphingobium resinovorum]|nr:hypothetical protein BES08_20455 [Novosphingobium resinovorum]
MTCQEAWTAYLRESGEFGGNAEKTLIDKRQTWDRLFAHTIGESLLTDVTFLELADIVDPLKTKGRRTAFNNAVRYVKKFFHGGGRIGSSHWAVGFTGSTAQDRKAEHA